MTCPQCQVLDGHSPSCARASLADDLDIDADELLDDEFVDDEVTALTAVPAEFFDDDKTPTAKPGSCWKCECIDPVFVTGPHPGSIHDFEYLPMCLFARDWAWCAVRRFARLGSFDIYLGPDNRKGPRVPFDLDRRRLPALPRDDDA